MSSQTATTFHMFVLFLIEQVSLFSAVAEANAHYTEQDIGMSTLHMIPQARTYARTVHVSTQMANMTGVM